MCRVHQNRASLSGVLLPHLDDCTSPVQAGMVPICLAKLMEQSQTVKTESSHPVKWKKSKASDLICSENLPNCVSQQQQQDQQVEYQKEQSAELCTK